MLRLRACSRSACSCPLPGYRRCRYPPAAARHRPKAPRGGGRDSAAEAASIAAAWISPRVIRLRRRRNHHGSDAVPQTAAVGIVYRQMTHDTRRARATGPGGHMGTATGSSVAGSNPCTGSSEKSLPGPALASIRPAPASKPIRSPASSLRPPQAQPDRWVLAARLLCYQEFGVTAGG
jgi:hypothetical protein